MTFAILTALSIFLLTLLGVRLAIMAQRKRAAYLSRPSLRGETHIQSPTGGGIPVVMALIIGLLIANIDYNIVIAIFLLAAISLMDELISVPFFVRLLVQLLAVGLPLCLMHAPLWGGFLPPWLDKALTAILWIGFINMFSFVDNIDGLSATEMISIGMGLSLLSALAGVFPDALSFYSLIVAAVGCGFLWWSWHPAKILLGAAGSIPIGFLLGYLLLLATLAGYGFAALILPAYYVADGMITALRKAFGHRQATFEYYCQKAIHRGRPQEIVARLVFGVNILLILLATLSVLHPHFGILYVATAYMVVFMLLGFFAHTPHESV